MRECPAFCGSGHPVIDRDHEILFSIVERLKDADLDATRLAAALTQLFAYLDAHFEHEEELMERHGYPLTSSHKEEHRRFRLEAERLAQPCTAPGPAVAVLVNAAAAWLEKHVCEVDAHFAEFLKTREVKPQDAEIRVF